MIKGDIISVHSLNEIDGLIEMLYTNNQSNATVAELYNQWSELKTSKKANLLDELGMLEFVVTGGCSD